MKLHLLTPLPAVVFVLATGCTSPIPSSSNIAGSAPNADLGVRPGVTRTLPKAPGPATFNIDQIRGTTAPLFANITVPVNLQRSDDLAIYGWAIDKVEAKPAEGVDITIDGTAWQADLTDKRPDVASFFKNPAYLQSGFHFHMRPASLAPGKHLLTVRVVANNGKAYYESPALTVNFK